MRRTPAWIGSVLTALCLLATVPATAQEFKSDLLALAAGRPARRGADAPAAA